MPGLRGSRFCCCRSEISLSSLWQRVFCFSLPRFAELFLSLSLYLYLLLLHLSL